MPSKCSTNQLIVDFYTKVLGFKQVNRPRFPFDGAWLRGAGVFIHLILADPTVPRKSDDWKVRNHDLLSNRGSLMQATLSLCGRLAELDLFLHMTLFQISLVASPAALDVALHPQQAQYAQGNR